MRVGILGSGCMGGKLGTLFTRAEHDVVFSYAPPRKAEKSWRTKPGIMRERAYRVRLRKGRTLYCWLYRVHRSRSGSPIIIAWRLTVSLNKSCCRAGELGFTRCGTLG